MSIENAGTGLSVAATIPSSCLHDIYRAAEEKERRTGEEVIKLHVGEPYFGPPPEVTNAMVDALHRGDTKYTAVAGMLELREALAEKLVSENGIDASASRIFTSPGSAQGLVALLKTLAEPGSEILLPELHWPVHLQQALLAGLRPVFYKLSKDFRPDVDSILAAATPRTRVLLINTPANPTGVVLDASSLRALLALARNQGWQIVSDEAYEHFVYDGEHISVASLERDVPVEERIVHSVFTFSKSLAMTGLRLGYVHTATEKAAETMGVVQEASIIGPATPVQYAGLAAVRAQGATEVNRKLVRQNRDILLPPLVEAGLLSELPAGGWYVVLNVERTGLDAETFAFSLLESKGVAVVPGAGFAMQPDLDDAGRITSFEFAPWSRHLVRVAFCVDPELLETGVARLLDFVRECDVELTS